MSKKNMKMLCLLLTTLFVMLGLTTIYATDNDTGITEVESHVTENINTHTDNNDVSNVIVKEENTQKQMNGSAVNQTKSINKNTVSTQTTKTASKTYTVTNSSSLFNALHNNRFSTVTINIKSDISDYNRDYADESNRKITINGNNKVFDGCLYFGKNSNVLINNLTIRNYDGIRTVYSEGNLTINGVKFINTASIYCMGNLKVSNSQFINNSDSTAGAITCYGNLTVNNVKFINNSCTGYSDYDGSGAVFCMGNCKVSNSQFMNNSGHSAGAIRCHGDLTINNVKFINNTSGYGNGYGTSSGAIKCMKNLNINNSQFINNSGPYFSVIYSESDMNITNTQFINNGEEFGHGAMINRGISKIINATFKNHDGLNQYGVINNYGVLTITNSQSNNNYISTVRNYGVLTITGSIFNGNKAWEGGAVYNMGNLTITNSKFNKNNASVGATVYNTGKLIVKNSNFTSNSLYDPEGTCDDKSQQSGSGAVFYTCNGTLKIYNSLFSKNNASYMGGVISSFKSTIYINNSNLSGNIAYVYNILYGENSNVTINNSNVNKNNKNNLLYGSKFQSSLSNLHGKLFIYNSIMDNNGIFYSDFNTKIVNTSFINNCYTTLVYDGNLTIQNSTFRNNTGSYLISERSESNSNNTINIKKVIFEHNTGFVNLNGIVSVSDSRFNDNPYNHHILKCIGNVRLTNLKFNNNFRNTGGDVVLTLNGNVTANGLTFKNNTLGRALLLNEYQSNLTISNSNFSNNEALCGVIYNNNGKLIVNNCIFKNNMGTLTYKYSSGSGAICNDDGELSVSNSIFKNNTSLTNGGAINNHYGKITVKNSIFSNNEAIDGGAIYSDVNDYKIYNSNFTYNKAGNDGGAIYGSGFHSPMHDDMNESYNTIQSRDYQIQSNILSGNIFSHNNAGNNGGAISVNRFNSIIKSNTFSYNTAKNGSAIYAKFENEYYKVIGYEQYKDLESGKPYTYKIVNGTYTLIGEGNTTIKNNTFIQNKANNYATAIIVNGTNNTIRKNVNDKTSVFSSTVFVNGFDNTISNNIFDDMLKNTTLFIYKIGNSEINKTVKVSGKLLYNGTLGIKGAIINININGRLYKAKTYSSGYFTVNYTVDNYNVQKISYKYDGDWKNYSPSSNSTSFKVKQPICIRIASMANVKYGTTVKIVGRLLDNSSKAVKYVPVNVTINGKVYQLKSDGAGYIRLNYTVNTYDNQRVTFKFAGNNLYLASSNYTTFKVKQASSIKHATIGNVKQGSLVQIVGRLLYNDTTPIKYVPVNLTVNSNVYQLKTDGAGYYRLNYTAVTEGINTFTSKFGGNNLYLPSSNSTNFTVIKS